MVRALALIAFSWLNAVGITADAGTIKSAHPGNYRKVLRSLAAGDTLQLDAGIYTAGLPIADCHGRANDWITIQGPATEGVAEIRQTQVANCVELRRCSYVALKRLKIQGEGASGVPGVFGISAQGGLGNPVHHILIEDCTISDWNTSQQAVGISTKSPAWAWTIRGNKILNCGTGLYLGNSNGEDPFVGGVIENNLVQNPLGYCLEIKFQKSRPDVEGMPVAPASTLVRHNVFIKSDASSPDGDRPNLLVGGFPASGPGADDLYEIYGNFFYHNPRESLLQASGRVAIHDNVFVDGVAPGHAAITLRDHDSPLKQAFIYNNTICSSARGIQISSPALEGHAVIGNLIFADTPTSFHRSITQDSANITGRRTDATASLLNPTRELGVMNLHPKPGECQGDALDLTPFAAHADYDLDFNRTSKGGRRFRGAYAGQGANPGWQLGAALKQLKAHP